MKVIVTGGAGFIGSHLVDRLVREDYDVVVFDDESADKEHFYWNPKAENRKRSIKHIDCSVCDGVDCIFHLAADTQIQPSIENPSRTFENNIMGTQLVLEAARKHKIKKVVFSSTSAVYGNNWPPHDEKMDVECMNPYATSKYCAEKLCKMYYELYGIQTICLRYFNVYGDRMPTKGSYCPVISIFQQQLAKNEPLTICGDGTQKRDFVHVSDVVNANMLAMNIDNNRCYGNVFNIGTGNTYTVNQVADLMGAKERVSIPERQGEIRESSCDNTKAKMLLAWKPKKCLEEYLQPEEVQT